MLVQLPNGNWIDPADVRRILYFPARKAGSDDPPRPLSATVAIVFARNPVTGIESSHAVAFDSDEAALAFRDELAAKINAAQAGEVKPEAGGSWLDRPPQL